MLPVACTTGTTPTDDDDATDATTSGPTTGSEAASTGASTGAGGAGGAGASSSSGFSTSQQASSSSGGDMCDGTGDCQTCANCSRKPGGICKAKSDACDANPDCVDFYKCVAACDQKSPTYDTCWENCTDTHPTGSLFYGDYAFCVLCDACYADCDGKKYKGCESL